MPRSVCIAFALVYCLRESIRDKKWGQENNCCVQRFRYRTRYFTDSGIIGTKAFVSKNYQRFKDIYYTQKEKLPKPISGLEGIYSLKRLAE